ncbi:MAG: LCP family protein [Lachnospiraceae bacterium]|nr:LCP family protein [Lachnospiraceae bacterium]
MKRETKYCNNPTKYRDEEYFERVALRKKIQEQTTRKQRTDRVRSYQEEKAYYENSKKAHLYGGQRERRATERLERSARTERALQANMSPRQERRYRQEQEVRRERAYRQEQEARRERAYRPEQEARRERTYRPEQRYFEEQELRRGRGYRKERPDKSSRTYKELKPKTKAGKVKKILIGILIFILLLAIGAGVVWFNPTLKTKAIKFALKSPLGPKVVNSIIGDNYEAYVHDKDFKDSEIRINNGAKTPEGNITIALFGVDARAEDLTIGTNADSMIIVNVDAEGNIRMGSIFRDTYLLTRGRDGDEVITKCNSAYFRGGPLGAINMLNENWDMAITDYVVVNFSGLTNIIDLLGGLRLKVTAEERDELNYHMYEQDAYAGKEYVPLEMYGDDVVLTGSQATAFSRLRSVPFESPEDGEIYSDDYGRTARQRYVLTELLAQAREQGMLHLLSLMNQLFAANSGDSKFIQTSLDIDELTALAAQAFDMNMDGAAAFPDLEHQYNAILDSGDSIVAYTLEENVVLLHQFLYGTENYTPTADLVNLAEKIRSEVARQTD